MDKYLRAKRWKIYAFESERMLMGAQEKEKEKF